VLSWKNKLTRVVRVPAVVSRAATVAPVRPNVNTRRQEVIRKLTAAIVVISVPVLSFGVAQIATTGSALAAGGPVTCTGTSAGQVLTYAAPGLSDLGFAQQSDKWKDTAGSAALKCTGNGKHGAGTFYAFKVNATSTTTCASDPNPPQPCPSGDYVYNSVNQYLNPDTLWKAVPVFVIRIPPVPCGDCPLPLHIDNDASSIASTGSGPGDCPSTELGVVFDGHLSTSPSRSTEITSCYSTDTGPGTSGNYAADFNSELAGNQSIVIQSVTLDGAASSVQIG
jgi:hypothetical protein